MHVANKIDFILTIKNMKMILSRMKTKTFCFCAINIYVISARFFFRFRREKKCKKFYCKSSAEKNVLDLIKTCDNFSTSVNGAK